MLWLAFKQSKPSMRHTQCSGISHMFIRMPNSYGCQACPTAQGQHQHSLPIGSAFQGSHCLQPLALCCRPLADVQRTEWGLEPGQPDPLLVPGGLALKNACITSRLQRLIVFNPNTGKLQLALD